MTITGYKAVFACSESDLNTFRKILSSRLYLIENGVDTDKFATDVSGKQANRTLLFIGRFSDNKRIDLLINLIAELYQLNKDYRLIIIGKDWDNNLIKFRQLISDKQCQDRVDIYTGLSDDEMKVYINASSFIVSASAYEGFGLSIIEAMAAGLIPICSDIDSFIKIVRGAGIGKIIDFNTENSHRTVHEFVNQQIETFGSQTLKAQQAASVYCWPVKSKEFSEYYESILGTKSRNIHGVQIDTQNSLQVIELLDTCLQHQRQTLLAFANAHTINLAQRNSDFKYQLSAFLVLNDGIGVELASQYKYGKGFSENLNGTDFIPKFLHSSAQKLNIFLLGASEKSVTATLSVWRKQYPQHNWCGYKNGYFEPEESLEIVKQINQSGANVLIVAMGNPKQEEWIYTYKDMLNVHLAVGVGALFDFTAGHVSRAPVWMQKLKMEWVYRLVQEPARMWRRYLVGNIAFLARTLSKA